MNRRIFLTSTATLAASLGYGFASGNTKISPKKPLNDRFSPAFTNANTEQEVLQIANNLIEQNRKTTATIKLVNLQGQPIQNRKLNIELSNHSFLFGAHTNYNNHLQNNKHLAREYTHFVSQIFNAVTLMLLDRKARTFDAQNGILPRRIESGRLCPRGRLGISQ